MQNTFFLLFLPLMKQRLDFKNKSSGYINYNKRKMESLSR